MESNAIVEACGWIAAACFAFSGLPQARKVIRQRHAHGLSYGFLALWTGGEIFNLVYGWHYGKMPIVANCMVNFLFIGPILWFRFFPTKETQ